MRKMQEYVVQGKQVFVGLEDSKRMWKLCVRSGGMIVQEVSMATQVAGLLAYLRGRYPACRIQVMYESGFQGFWLHDALVAAGIGCVVTPAHTVSQEKVSRVKTDKTDARRLAKNLESGDYRVCHVPTVKEREDRQVSRALQQIQRDIVRTKNRIRKFLDFHGLNADLPAGKWGDGRYLKLEEDLTLGRSLRVSLAALLTELQCLRQVRAQLHAELKALAKQEGYRQRVALKQSCPGIGWLTAIRLTLEWGELDRFTDEKKLASFVGLAVAEHSSGETTRRGHITKQGSRQVRGWLIQCAWRAVSRDPVLGEKYRAVWGRSGSKKKAIVAVARKLVGRRRAIELTGLPYQLGTIR